MSGVRLKLMMCAAVTVAIAIGTGWSFAQRDKDNVAADTLIPAEAALYFSTDGSLLHQAAFEKTAAYDALYKSGLMDVVQDAINGFTGQIPSAAEGAQAFKHVQEHGLTIGVVVDPPNQGPPSPWGVIVLHDAEDGIELFAKIAEEMPGSEIEDVIVAGRQIVLVKNEDLGPVQIGAWAEQGHLVIAVGINSVDSALAVMNGDRPNLEGNNLLAKYKENVKGTSIHSTGFLNLKPLKETFGGMPVPAPKSTPDNPITVNDVMIDLGIDNLNHIASISGYRGRSLWSEVIVDAPGDRRGLLSLMDQKPFTFDDLPPMSPGHSGFMVSSFDWGAGYDTILQTARTMSSYGPPDVEEELDELLNEARRELGMDVRQELLSALGHVNCFYTDSHQGYFGLGSTMMVSVKNKRQLKRSISKLLSKVQEEARGDVMVRSVEKQGHIVTLIEFPEFPIAIPSLCVTDEWLIIGAIPQSVEATLLRLNGDLPSWEPTEDILAGMGEMPKEMTSLVVMDPRETYRQALGAGPMLIGMMEVGARESGDFPDDFEFPITGADLPPADLVVNPLFANITVTTVGDSGLHTRSRESMAGIPIIGGGGGGSTVATTGILVALLLPAVQQAREAARRTQSMNNMRNILLACHNYHDVYNHFPQGTVPNDDLEPEERLSWLVSILPYIEQAPLYNNLNMKKGWADEANDFWIQEIIPFYLNPSSPQQYADGYGATSYAGIAGVGADAPTLPNNHKRAGIFGYNRKASFRDITDGTSNTVMISEADARSWGKGGPATIRPFAEKPYVNGPDGFTGHHPGVVMMGFADGSVRAISENIDPEVMEALATKAGGEVIGEF